MTGLPTPEELERLKIAFATSLMNANAGMRWLDHDSMDEMIEAAWVGFQEPAIASRIDPSPALGDVERVTAALKERGRQRSIGMSDSIWREFAETALASLRPNRDGHAMCHEEGCSLAHIPYRLASCGCLQPNRDVSAPCSTCEGTGIYNSYDDDGREFECYECDGSGVASLSSTDGEPT
jgi:hypothetical protein